MDPAYSSVPVPASGPRRPVGLVLAAIVLGLITLFWFVAGLVSIFGAAFVRMPQTSQPPAVEGVQLGIGIGILLLCGLCAYVVVGLFRLRNSARVGILIVGAVVAFYSLMTTAIFCVMAFMNLDAFIPAGTPNVSPALIKAMFLAMCGISFVFFLVGVWWLVYFNLERVRALFVMNVSNGVIEPIVRAPISPSGVRVNPAVPRRGVVEILVICLAVLYFWGAVSVILSAFLRFPLFMFGHVFRGMPASVVMLVVAVFELWLGIGLLRRMKAAWIGALAFNACALLYTLTMFSPGSRAAMINYQDEIVRSVHGPLPPPSMNQLLVGPMYVLSAVVGVLMAAAIFWLLWRAKPLFEPKPS